VTANAAGEVGLPMAVWPYMRIPSHVADAQPPGWVYEKSPSGWMRTDIFTKFITEKFYPYLVERGIEFPVVVFVDGHTSHLSMPLSQFCDEHEIILICLPPNTTHILQVLDVVFFFPMKKKWKNLLATYRLSHEEELKKDKVPEALQEIFDTEDFRETLKNGFRVCGLYPFSPDAVNYSKLITSSRESECKSPEKDIGKLKVVLDCIESRIPDNILVQFRSLPPIYENVEYRKLYELWKSFYTDVHPTSCITSVSPLSKTLLNIDATQSEILSAPFDTQSEMLSAPFDADHVDFPEWENNAFLYNDFLIEQLPDNVVEVPLGAEDVAVLSLLPDEIVTEEVPQGAEAVAVPVQAEDAPQSPEKDVIPTHIEDDTPDVAINVIPSTIASSTSVSGENIITPFTEKVQTENSAEPSTFLPPEPGTSADCARSPIPTVRDMLNSYTKFPANQFMFTAKTRAGRRRLPSVISHADWRAQKIEQEEEKKMKEQEIQNKRQEKERLRLEKKEEKARKQEQQKKEEERKQLEKNQNEVARPVRKRKPSRKQQEEKSNSGDEDDPAPVSNTVPTLTAHL
jgi:hypothetical protein